MILNDTNATDGVITYTVTDSTEIPSTGLDDKSIDLIKKALLGTPSKLLVYVIPPKSITTTCEEQVQDQTTGEYYTQTIEDTVESTVKFNYICHPTGTMQDQEDLAVWVKAQRNNKHRTIKGIVANVDADSYGVINFTTGNIHVVNSEYTDALIAAEGIAEAVPEDIPQYLHYTAAEYTARIMGVACGITLDRSMTYYEWIVVKKVDTIYENN